MRPLLLLLLASLSAFAQPFSAGIKAGVPLTDFVDAAGNGVFNYKSPTQRYIVGGVAELRLPFGLGVEVDALYRRLHYTGSGSLVGDLNTIQTIDGGAGNWEFPLLLKYRFPAPVVRPFVDAGVAWDTLTGVKETISSLSATPIALTGSNFIKNTTMGFVVGAGVDIHAVFLHISPEIRFTRWNSAQIGDASGLLHSNLNQAEFLVGFTF
jgi:hypothetical protein